MNSTCLALRSLPALHLLEISGAVSVDGEEKKVQLFQFFSLSLLFLCTVSYTYLTQTATMFIKSQVQEKQKSFAEISYKNVESTAPMSFQSLHFPQGLTSEVCAVVTPISIDLSAFPLLFENDIMFPAASSGRQCEPAFL